jgi:hypothetical protein
LRGDQGHGGEPDTGGLLGRLHRRWSASSILAKLGVLAMPIFVAAVGVVVPKILNPKSSPSERLETAGLAVRDYAAVASADIRIRNVGEQIAVLDTVRFRIRDFRQSTVGGCFRGGAELPPAPTVDATLPGSNAKGRVVAVDVSRQLPPNSADRIVVRFWPEPYKDQVAGFYELEVEIFHDGDRKPMDAGTMVIADPFPESHMFSDANLRARAREEPHEYTPAVQRRERSCIARNRRILSGAAAFDGVRSARLAEFIANPASFEPTSPSFDRTTEVVAPVTSPRQCDPVSWYEGEEAEIEARIKRGELLLTPGRATPCIPEWELELRANELNQVLAVLPRPRDDGRWIDWFHVSRDDLEGETPYAALIHGEVARVVCAARTSLRQTC